MSSASEWAGKQVSLNMGGSAQIGQIDFEEPRPIPSWLPVGGVLTQYGTFYTDGQDYFGIPAGCGAWNDSTATPTSLNLLRYLAAAVMTVFANAGLPVKNIMSQRCSNRVVLTFLFPCTTAIYFSSKVSLIISSMTFETSGTYGEGFNTAVQPADIAPTRGFRRSCTG